MSGPILALAMTLAAQDASAADLRRQADAARAQYEALQAKALAAEISESEKAVAAQQAALDAQRARLAALRAPAASLPALPAPAVAAPAPVALIAAAQSSGATVTSETSTTTNGTTVSQKTTVTPLSQRDIADGENKRKFGGIEFGVGIAYTLDTGRYQRIREAELVNGIVRVNRSENSSARFVLESHYLFTPINRRLNGNTNDFLGLTNSCEKWTEETTKAGDEQKLPPKRTCETIRAQWGIGPFVALQPGTDNVIDAIGTGIMVGLRRSSKSTDSFNLGIGAMVDINAQTLGNGIVEDQPPPAGDTLRFKRRSQLGLLLMSSYSF